MGVARWWWLSGLALLACGGSESHGVPGDVGRGDYRDEVIYQIVVDRFADGDPTNNALEGVTVDPTDLARHQGGDFRGIFEHLDYLEQLGATALWISPIVANVPRHGDADGYHGYWASDFTRVNPRFGTLTELRALVDAAHARGMKVLLDVVINHTGSVFFYDLDGDGTLDPGESEPTYRAAGYASPVFRGTAPTMWRAKGDALETFTLGPDFFHLRGQTVDWSSAEQIVLGDFPTGLRDLATSENSVVDALVDTYAEWVRLTDVDGFRLDAAPHVRHAEWKRFCTGIRAKVAALGKTRFMLLGEVFRGNPDELASYTAPGEFDSVFDFTLKWDAVDQYVLEGGTPVYARDALERARAAYPAVGQSPGLGLNPWQARVAFADNHDMARLRGRLDDEGAAALALALVFTVDAIPAIYYGTEQGFKGQGGHGSREVLWTTGFDETARPYRVIQLLTGLRRAHPALRYGDLVVRYAATFGGRGTGPGDVVIVDPADPDEMQAAPDAPSEDRDVDPAELPEDAGMLAFERITDGERILAVFNATAVRESRARMATGFAQGDVLYDLFGSDLRVTVGAGGEVDVTVPRRSAVLLARE